MILFTNMQKKVLTSKLQEGCEVSDVMYQMKMRLGLLTTCFNYPTDLVACSLAVSSKIDF